MDLAKGVAAGDLAEDRPVAGKWQGEDVVLVCHGGRVCALSGHCTHQDAPMEDGLVVGGELRCPWHHARFDLATGEAVGAPAFEPLRRYEAVEEDGRVRIVGKAEPASQGRAAAEIGRVVIVGGGAASHACADMLARHGAGAGVTVLSADADAPYDRTECSKAYLAGEMERAATALPACGLGRGPSPTVRTGVSVARILAQDGAVETSDGERIDYDTLVLATGAEPRRADFEGSGRDDVFVLRTLADADALIAAAGSAKSAVVLGSSFIGLEVAAALIGRGLKVSVVSQEDAPLAKTLGADVGAWLKTLHEEKGATFHLGRRVSAWDGRSARLDNGETVEGDLLVMGVGVAPRVELARAAGLAIAEDEEGGGIRVDGELRTSDPRIYAIGDVASAPDPRLGRRIRVEHWVVAQRMGQWLARRLLGRVEGAYADAPFFWTAQYDLGLHYVGHVRDPGDRRLDGDLEAEDFAVTYRQDAEPRALLTCGRDIESLKTEARWEAETGAPA